jgi:hypothetical protein
VGSHGQFFGEEFMSRENRPEPDDKEQSDRFIETAKRLGADKGKEAFEEAVGKIVKKKRLPKTQPNSIPDES